MFGRSSKFPVRAVSLQVAHAGQQSPTKLVAGGVWKRVRCRSTQWLVLYLRRSKTRGEDTLFTIVKLTWRCRSQHETYCTRQYEKEAEKKRCQERIWGSDRRSSDFMVYHVLRPSLYIRPHPIRPFCPKPERHRNAQCIPDNPSMVALHITPSSRPRCDQLLTERAQHHQQRADRDQRRHTDRWHRCPTGSGARSQWSRGWRGWSLCRCRRGRAIQQIRFQ